jgi:cation:H+ antiporter
VAALDFGSYPPAINGTLFAVSAIVVWIPGTKVAHSADELAVATGVGHATVGLVLLAGITSLPEVAVAVTSAASDAPGLSVNNLLGGVAMQIAILAVADAAIGRQALTVIAGTPLLLLQGTATVLMLLVLVAAVVVGDLPLLGAGLWSWGLVVLYLLAIWTIANAQGSRVWAVRVPHEQAQPPDPTAHQPAQGGGLNPLALKLAAGSAAILVAGFALSRTGDAIAAQTGLGRNFVGAVFLALSTSLPEISAVVAAVKLRRYEMAMSDIFGTGLFNVALVFVVDVVYGGPPVLNEVGRFSLLAAVTAAVLVCIYLAGLIERRDRTVARMGLDSLAVLLVYGGSLAILYHLR